MNRVIVWLIIIGLVIVGAIFGYQRFGVEKELSYELATVIRGDIYQEVSETGTIKVAEEIDLGFKNPGRIEKVYVKVGQEVKASQELIKLETSQLEIQLNEAEAALELVQAKLNQLLAGLSQEEIRLAETAVQNTQDYLTKLQENTTRDIAVAQTTVNNVEQNLEDVKAEASSDLDQAYEDALNTLDDAYLKIYNVYNVVDLIQRTYFVSNDQEGITVREKESTIESVMQTAKSYLDVAKDEPTNENIDTALSEMSDALAMTSDALAVVRDTCEEPVYRDTVSTTDKDSLDTQRTNINTALTNVVNSQQTISSTKLTNATNINNAQASLDSAKENLKALRAKSASLLSKPKKSV